MGFPWWLSDKDSTCQCRRHGFDTWVRKIPWRRKWQPTSAMHQAQWSPERPLPPPVSLASQSHHDKPPEVTCTSRETPGCPASTRESPRETSFNTSRGQIPLPWLRSNDALPLATRMQTRLPWRPTRDSLTSPSYLVKNRTLGPPLENNPEIRTHTHCATYSTCMYHIQPR